MSAQDWQNALRGLIDEAGLPEGTEATVDPSDTQPKQKGKLSISYEKKGREGKQVTIISGFNIDSEELNKVAATLKRNLGTGGSARGGEILIQGDRRNDVKTQLTAMGFKF